jgi:hypothetical protein
MPITLSLPEHYDASPVEISPTCDELDGSGAFFSLVDELHAEMQMYPEDLSFYHQRSSLLKAYGERRLYGMYARRSEEMHTHKSFKDSIFVRNKHGIVHRMLPCFLVLEKEWDGRASVCTFLWTAKRARNKGIATTLLDFFDVRQATDILPEAVDFWRNWFAYVQDDLDDVKTE